MENKKTHIYNYQNTVRLSEDELNYIDENYEDIAGTSDKISISKFFMKAVTAAVTTIKPKEKEVIKEVPVEDPELQEKLQELQAHNEELQKELNDCQARLPKKSALVLNFPPEMRQYIWGVLEISKKQNFAKTYEELFQKMFEVLHKRGELILDKDDVAYLKTLKKDYEDD